MRDPWALAAIAGALLLVARTWFAFVGEPVADDFDYLHRALVQGHIDWLDGGGSRFYWRPIPRQVYYQVFGALMLAHGAWMAALATLWVALSGLLLQRALHHHWPGSWAAAAISFPLVLEASRTLVSSPSNFSDLGALLFSALALQQATRRRMLGALVALLAALLCKEVAVLTAAALPLLMPAAERRRERLRWAAATAVVVGLWAASYAFAIHHAHLLLARDAVPQARALAAPWLARFLWACGESLRDIANLPALSPALRQGAVVALAVVAAVTVVTLATDRNARLRVRAWTPWIAGGLGWFALSTAVLADVYPDWRPYRSLFGALGIGVACAPLLGAARPALLAALVLVRLATFVLSPGPPRAIAADVSGAYSLDFTTLVQLQRLVAETRRTLATVLPRPAPGTKVAMHYFPRGAMHAFTGDRSLQTWYRDTTLHWAMVEAGVLDERRASLTVLQFQPTPPRQVVPVSAEGLWHVDRAWRLIDNKQWDEGLQELVVAESLEHEPEARVFASMVDGKRAVALVGVARLDEADRAAQRSLDLWDGNDDARYALVGSALRRGRTREAAAMLDALVLKHPEDAGLRRLLDNTRRALTEGSP